MIPFDLQGFFPQLLEGTWLTIRLALSALGIGLILGLLGALGRLSHNYFIQYTTRLLVSIIRGVPELIILFLVYYGGVVLLTWLFGRYVEISPFMAGVLALSMIFGAYASETFRGAYLAVPKGQLEAATALGFSRWQSFRRILLPQMLRHALPGLGNLWFVLIKDTALISLLGAVDLMRAAQNATASTQKPFTFYLAAAILYLILTSISLIGLRYVNQRANRFTREATACQ